MVVGGGEEGDGEDVRKGEGHKIRIDDFGEGDCAKS